MNLQNNIATIKLNLANIEKAKLVVLEKNRSTTYYSVKKLLIEFFKSYPECEVFLFGSIITPYHFNNRSDIDIAVRNFKGSRLDLFGELEKLMDIPFDLIIIEKCSFAESIETLGEKII